MQCPLVSRLLFRLLYGEVRGAGGGSSLSCNRNRACNGSGRHGRGDLSVGVDREGRDFAGELHRRSLAEAHTRDHDLRAHGTVRRSEARDRRNDLKFLRREQVATGFLHGDEASSGSAGRLRGHVAVARCGECTRTGSEQDLRRGGKILAEKSYGSSDFRGLEGDRTHKRFETGIETIENAVIVRPAKVGQAVDLSVGVKSWKRVRSRAVRSVKAVNYCVGCAIRLELENGAIQRSSAARSHSVEETVTALNHTGGWSYSIGPRVVVEVVDHGINTGRSHLIDDACAEGAAYGSGPVEVAVSGLQNRPVREPS